MDTVLMDANKITVLSAVIGVIGTILGTILGYALNSWGNKGKISILNIKLDETYQKTDGLGSIVETDNILEANYYNFIISLNVYNSSNNIKIMKEIKFHLYNGSELIKVCVPYDETTKRTNALRNIRDKMQPVNLPPKTINPLTLSCFFDDRDFILQSTPISISISYENEKGKTKYVKIKNDKT